MDAFALTAPTTTTPTKQQIIKSIKTLMAAGGISATDLMPSELDLVSAAISKDNRDMLAGSYGDTINPRDVIIEGYITPYPDGTRRHDRYPRMNGCRLGRCTC